MTSALQLCVMSISERATHVLSTMLIMVFASAVAGWTSIAPTTHCTRQTHSCTPVVSLTCRCPTASNPVDRVQPPQLAQPEANVSTGSLMDDMTPVPPIDTTSFVVNFNFPRVLCDLDLGMFNRALLI